jgi:hypothetical protein
MAREISSSARVSEVKYVCKFMSMSSKTITWKSSSQKFSFILTEGERQRDRERMRRLKRLIRSVGSLDNVFVRRSSVERLQHRYLPESCLRDSFMRADSLDRIIHLSIQVAAAIDTAE